MIWVRMEIIFSAALVIALPVMLFEILMFVRPALEAPQELAMFRAVAIVGAPLVLLFFIAGLAFAYYVLLPVMLPFLLGHWRFNRQSNVGHPSLLLVRAGRAAVDRRGLRDTADHGDGRMARHYLATGDAEAVEVCVRWHRLRGSRYHADGRSG